MSEPLPERLGFFNLVEGSGDICPVAACTAYLVGYDMSALASTFVLQLLQDKLSLRYQK